MQEDQILKYLSWLIGFITVFSLSLENPRHSIYTFTSVMVMLFIIILYKYDHNLISSKEAFLQTIIISIISYLNFRYKSIEIARIEEEERKNNNLYD